MTPQDWVAEAAINNVREAHRNVREARAGVRIAHEGLIARAADARRKGVTLAEIGKAMGLTRQRVHQMLKDAR